MKRRFTVIVNRQINGKMLYRGHHHHEPENLLPTTATIAAPSLNATWVHAEDDDNSVNGVETNTVNSQSSSCYGHVIRVRRTPRIAQLHLLAEECQINGYYYGTTADPILINAALHAMNGPTQVRIHSEYGCGGNNGQQQHRWDLSHPRQS